MLAVRGNAAGSGLLLGIVDQDVDHAVSAGEGHLHAVGGVIDLFNVCKGPPSYWPAFLKTPPGNGGVF